MPLLTPDGSGRALRPSPGTQTPQRGGDGKGLRVILRRIPGLTPSSILRRDFLFQCPPLEEFPRQYGYSFEEYVTLSRDQHARYSSRDLSEFTFQTLFVEDNPRWSLLGRDVPDPLDMAEEMKEIADKGFPFRLIVHQKAIWGRADVNIPATIRSIRIAERHGETETRYVDVTFKEHRSVELVSARRA